MSDEIPSPASRRPVEPASRVSGPTQPPWAEALLGAVRARLERVERENAELHHVVAQLNARLYRANQARERWLLRQQAWHRERAELLERLGNPRWSYDDDGRRHDL